MSDITVVVADSTPQNVVVSSSTPDITEVINIGPAGTGGGTSYDQSLNTTDSPTFVGVNTASGTLQGGVYPGFFADGHGFEMTHGDQNQGTIDVFAPTLSSGQSVSVTLPSSSGTLAIGNQSLNTTNSPTFHALTIDDGDAGNNTITFEGFSISGYDNGAGFGPGGVSGHIDSDHGDSFSLDGSGVVFKIGENTDAEVPTSHYGHGVIEYTTTTNGTKSFTLPSASGTLALTSEIPAVGTAAALDAPATGNASSSQVVLGSDSRLSDSRYPTTHNQSLSTIVPTGFGPTYGAAPIWTQGSGAVPDRWIMTSPVATLVNGLVPASQLPSYVDDVLEYSSTSSFPATGEAGKIYVATGTGLIYRWSGSVYVEISPSTAQVQSDWNASSGLGVILNKPSLASVATSGSASDLATGTLPDAMLSSNVVTLTGTQTLTNKSISAGQITGLATVATSGAYSSLSGTPSLASIATSGSYTDLSNLPIQVKKSSADIAVTSLTLSDVTGLTGFTLAANTTYRFEFTGRMTTSSSAASFQVCIYSDNAFAAGSMSGYADATGTINTNRTYALVTSTTYSYYFMQKTGQSTNNVSSAQYYIVTGSTAPTVKIQFSQYGTASGTSTLFSGAVAAFTKLI